MSYNISSSLLNPVTNYQEISRIGNGAYATVYRGLDISTNAVVALKKVRVPLTKEGLPLNTLREISLLKQLDTHEHPNIVRLLDICHGQRLEKEQQLDLFLVFEYADQDLATFISRCQMGELAAPRIKEIMSDIMNGVDFLHSNRIVHRDLKPQNLLVCKSGRIKLADFGLAKTYDFEMRLTSVVVTLWYRSPEVLLGMPYATSVDIWSCGCIMAELYTLQPLFAGSSDGNQLEKIFQIIGTPTESEWPQSASIAWSSLELKRSIPFDQIIPNLCEDDNDLMQKMLKFNPKERISSSQILAHPFFTSETIPA